MPNVPPSCGITASKQSIVSGISVRDIPATSDVSDGERIVAKGREHPLSNGEIRSKMIIGGGAPAGWGQHEVASLLHKKSLSASIDQHRLRM